MPNLLVCKENVVVHVMLTNKGSGVSEATKTESDDSDAYEPNCAAFLDKSLDCRSFHYDAEVCIRYEIRKSSTHINL